MESECLAMPKKDIKALIQVCKEIEKQVNKLNEKQYHANTTHPFSTGRADRAGKKIANNIHPLKQSKIINKYMTGNPGDIWVILGSFFFSLQFLFPLI